MDAKNLLGHSSIVLATYGHVLEQRHEQVARGMDAVSAADDSITLFQGDARPLSEFCPTLTHVGDPCKEHRPEPTSGLMGHDQAIAAAILDGYRAIAIELGDGQTWAFNRFSERSLAPAPAAAADLEHMPVPRPLDPKRAD